MQTVSAGLFFTFKLYQWHKRTGPYVHRWHTASETVTPGMTRNRGRQWYSPRAQRTTLILFDEASPSRQISTCSSANPSNANQLDSVRNYSFVVRPYDLPHEAFVECHAEICRKYLSISTWTYFQRRKSFHF